MHKEAIGRDIFRGFGALQDLATKARAASRFELQCTVHHHLRQMQSSDTLSNAWSQRDLQGSGRPCRQARERAASTQSMSFSREQNTGGRLTTREPSARRSCRLVLSFDSSGPSQDTLEPGAGAGAVVWPAGTLAAEALGAGASSLAAQAAAKRYTAEPYPRSTSRLFLLRYGDQQHRELAPARTGHRPNPTIPVSL